MNFRNFLLVVTLLFSLALVLPAQQTVDPSGTCVVQSTEVTITGQTGSFYCKPSSFGGSTGTWTKMTHGINTVASTINFNNATLAAAAALTANVTVTTLPAGSVVLHARIKPTVVWAGTATLTGSIGDATSDTAFTATQDLKAALANTTFVANTAPKITTEAADIVFVHFIATTNNLNVLSAGALKATVVYALPADGSITVASMYPMDMYRGPSIKARWLLDGADRSGVILRREHVPIIG